MKTVVVTSSPTLCHALLSNIRPRLQAFSAAAQAIRNADTIRVGRQVRLRRSCPGYFKSRGRLRSAADSCEGQIRILELLVRHADQVFSRQTIFLNVWGYHFDPGTKVLEVQLSYLRRVLAALGCAVKIDTHRGQGLRLLIFS
ncbi:winged helix-turn-helix domain-containing protein [Pseudomonas sp. NPDC089758]|uniref:winged helix-turn-helix domain-containing protein n=1 Tax=Pseudomonas sp. NPDC089758 TaxID=3364473 RepID=UPI0038026482